MLVFVFSVFPASPPKAIRLYRQSLSAHGQPERALGCP